jgi:Fe-S-cluster formation regulator IscX/YfhJ
MDPLDVPSRMLTAGEFTKLTQEIMDLNDFDDVESLEDEAKN